MRKIAGGPVERLGQSGGIAAAERHDEGRGRAQIGADAHLGHGHLDAGQFGIAQLAAGQDLDQRMAQRFADPQLALARAATGFAFVSSCTRALGQLARDFLDLEALDLVAASGCPRSSRRPCRIRSLP